jgi:predicted dehydrogenase
MSNGLGVGIIGCGLIGHRRARALASARLVAAADIDLERAKALAATKPECEAFSNWHEAVAHPDVQIVIVSTLHDTLAEITAGAIAAGRHVLVEKPAARRARELESVIAAARARNVKVRVGFNHRYHRAFLKARELVDAGALGKLMFLRARYGHGGRLGYDREWRADMVRSGGGELIDQGSHLIDLARWFLGDFTGIDGFAYTYYWDMPVDDNGFLLLKTASQQVAFLHASCTEWKNTFSFELYGSVGKIDISGLGGSYGTERLVFYRMLPEMGPPETTAWEYPMADNSWDTEFVEFLADIEGDRTPSAGLADAVAALRIIERIYEVSGYDYRT